MRGHGGVTQRLKAHDGTPDAPRPGMLEAGLARPVAVLIIAAGALFVGLTAVAMVLYPGGNARDRTVPGYSPSLNFFSDLGATHAYNGAPNWTSLGLFCAGLGFVGVTLVTLGCGVSCLRRRTRLERRLVLAAVVFAVLTGLCFLGIAATPWDIALTPHMVFVSVGFLAVTLFSLCLLTLQLLQHWPVMFWLPNAAYVVLLVAYEALMVVYADHQRPAALEVQVVGQKVIVYASILNIGWQALGMLRRRRVT